MSRSTFHNPGHGLAAAGPYHGESGQNACRLERLFRSRVVCRRPHGLQPLPAACLAATSFPLPLPLPPSRPSVAYLHKGMRVSAGLTWTDPPARPASGPSGPSRRFGSRSLAEPQGGTRFEGKQRRHGHWATGCVPVAVAATPLGLQRQQAALRLVHRVYCRARWLCMACISPGPLHSHAGHDRDSAVVVGRGSGSQESTTLKRKKRNG